MKFGKDRRGNPRRRCESCHRTFTVIQPNAVGRMRLPQDRAVFALKPDAGGHLFIAWYNVCRKHSTIRTTPAVAAGLTDEPWTIERLLREVAQ